MARKNDRNKIKLFSKVTEDDIMSFYRLFSNQKNCQSKLSDLYEGLDEVNWQLNNAQKFNWQLTNRLKFKWQLTFAFGFTDNWQNWLSFIFCRTSCRPFYNIVPLFSSDDVIKCAFIWVILARQFPVEVMCVMHHPLTLLWERTSIHDGCWWGWCKSNCKRLPRWIRHGLSWSFLQSTYV